MDFEFWWLIGFPIFFGLGWLAARIDIKHLLTESRALPRAYFKGLNFLLNEQPDKAIEAFIEVVKVDPETVDLHFALGGLFRRRGETERAIRMHKNLLERSDLAADQRVQALFELGHDYLKAGLLDRAEEVFVRLRDSAQRLEALRRLLEIYQQEKDWQRAIETARALETGDRPVVAEGDRRVLLRARRGRGHALAPGGGARAAQGGAQGEPQVRPREHPRRRPRGRRRARARRDRGVEARRDAEPDLPRARRPPAPEELPDRRRPGDRAHAAARLSRSNTRRSISWTSPSSRRSTPRVRRPRTGWSGTSCAAIPRCSGWTSCSRPSSSARRWSGATTSSSCATSCRGRRAGSRATAARTAASAPASSTGSARRA